MRLPSGGGHDAMVMARYMPTAMLFVPSIGGRSHDVERCVLGAEAVDPLFGGEVDATELKAVSFFE